MKIKKCLVCGKEIQVKDCLLNRKKFCSIKCRHIGMKLKLIPGKRKTGIPVRCPTCKKSFYIKKCSIGQKKYCSKECYRRSQIGKSVSPEFQFKKGQKAWNKGTKGICKPNSGSYQKGILNRNFKGIIKHQGYILIYSPDHPFCDSHNYVKRSRLVMEKHLGRYLKPIEVVHHINHIRDYDRLENLMLFPNNFKHQAFHESEKKEFAQFIRNKYKLIFR